MLRISRWTALQVRITVVAWLVLVVPAGLVTALNYGRVADIMRADRINTVVRIADFRHDKLSMLLRRQAVRARVLLANYLRHCDATALTRGCGRDELRGYLDSEQAVGLVLANAAGDQLQQGAPGISGAEIPHLASGQLAQFSSNQPDPGRRYYIVADLPQAGLRVAVTYPLQAINAIFEPHPDLGASGENFLTDTDGFFISKARYTSIQGHSHPIAARPLEQCLRSDHGSAIDLDYRGVVVIHGFRQVPEIGGGCIMAHIDAVEAFAPLAALEESTELLALAYAVLALIAAAWFGTWIARLLAQAQARA